MKRNSAALLLLTLKPGGAPVANTAVPTHNGTAPVIGTQITGTAGTWTGGPTLTYQWQRNTGSWADIGGATSINYTPVDADFGLTLRLSEIPNGVTANAANSAATGAVAADMTSNLIAYWSLEEASGTRNDSHSTNHLTDTNTVTQATGKIGNAGQFTAANTEYLTIADNAALSVGNIDFTWACWVYLDTLGTARGIVSKYGGGAAETIEYELRILNTNIMRFFVGNGVAVSNSVQATTHGAFSASTWYFVVAWHDATANTINVQINNGATDSQAYSSGGYDGGFALNIGASSGAVPHNGRIDEVAFWKRTLTAAEKTMLYNGGAGASYALISGGA